MSPISSEKQMGALLISILFNIIKYPSIDVFAALKSICVLMILPATCWLHSSFFFPQRREVNLFASIQAAISMYIHRSLYNISSYSTAHSQLPE